MTSKADFDKESWRKIASAPIIAAAVISASDDVGDDRESEDEEIDAFKASLVRLRKKYGKSQLVNEVIDFIEKEGTQEFEDLFHALGAAASHESPIEDRIKGLEEMAVLLDNQADKKDTRLYKKFVMDAATEVASASKEGFFVFGSRISKKEDFFLRQIQAVLGI